MFETIGILGQYLATKFGPRPCTLEALERHQERQLAGFQRNVLSKSTFYAPYLDRALTEFPIMDKATMMANFDAINTVGLKLDEAMAVAVKSEETRDFSPKIGNVSVGLSTGTSGRRGIFVASDKERQKWAGIILARMLPGSILESHRVGFFLRANNNLYESVSGKGRIAFRFFDLMKSFDGSVAELEKFDPTIIIAPAQVLRLLAKANTASSTPIRPKKVISVAEVLFDDDRAVIENGFGISVSEIYQCTEGFLAYTCDYGCLHLNERYLHVELDWIDESLGRCRPIITDFSRHSQPIVRYRLDDVLTIDPVPCPCGSPECIIARVEGREDDMLELLPTNGGEPAMIVPDYITRAIVAVEDIKDFAVIQTGLDEIEVYLEADQSEDVQVAVKKSLLNLWKMLGVVPPHMRILSLASASLTQKRRRVRRQFRQEAIAP